MKKKIWILLCILWVLIIADAFWEDAYGLRTHGEFNITDDVIVDGDYRYITENTEDDGIIYKIGTDYNVDEVFAVSDFSSGLYIQDTAKYGDYVYLFVRGYVDDILDGQYACANILKLDKDLKLLETYKWVKLDKETGVEATIAVDDKNIYLLVISGDGKESYIYSIPLADMVPYSRENVSNYRDVSVLQYRDYVRTNDDYRYVYVGLIDGNLYTYKNGIGGGTDLITSSEFDARELFDNKKLSLMQIIEINKGLAVRMLLLGLGGIFLIISIFCIFRPKNRVVFWILIWELTLLLVYWLSYSAMNVFVGRHDITEYRQYSDFVLDILCEQIGVKDMSPVYDKDYYYTKEYREKSNTVFDIRKNNDSNMLFEEICLVSKADNKVLLSVCGLEGYDVGFLYGDAISEIVDKAARTDSCQIRQYLYKGINYYFVADVYQNSDIVTLAAFTPVSDDSDVPIRNVIRTLLMFMFVFSSLFGIFILLWQSRDLHVFGNSLEKVSLGKSGEVKKPNYHGEDMGDMWNGLLDIDRNIKNLNYIRFKVFEAFYRFAPKSMERVLEKKSITDVYSGDYTVKQGTIGTVIMTNNGNNEVDFEKMGEIMESRLNLKNERHILSLISEYQESGKGFQVAFNSTLSELTMLFPDSNRNVCDFGREFYEIQDSKTNDVDGYVSNVFLDYDTFVYGVVGVDNQYMQYLVNQNLDPVDEGLTILLALLNLRLVITQSVFEHERSIPEYRYIGTFLRENGEEVKLYEILDVYRETDRKLRLETREIFNKALSLFMEDRFYDARNLFAQILKSNANDEVARSYVFICEKYLDTETIEIEHCLNQI